APPQIERRTRLVAGVEVDQTMERVERNGRHDQARCERASLAGGRADMRFTDAAVSLRAQTVDARPVEQQAAVCADPSLELRGHLPDPFRRVEIVPRAPLAQPLRDLTKQRADAELADTAHRRVARDLGRRHPVELERVRLVETLVESPTDLLRRKVLEV